MLKTMPFAAKFGSALTYEYEGLLLTCGFSTHFTRNFYSNLSFFGAKRFRMLFLFFYIKLRYIPNDDESS